MSTTLLLIAAASLQLLAGYKALRLVGASRGIMAWVLIAVAFLLLGLRLVIELFLALVYDYRVNPWEEWVDFAVAALCLFSVKQIGTLFERLHSAERERQNLFEDAQRQWRRAEKRAIEAKQKNSILDALMEHIPAGVAIVRSPDMHIQMASRYASELSGLLPEDLQESRFGNHARVWGVCHPDGSPAEDEELPIVRAVRNGETVRHEEWGMLRADGSCYTALASAGPIRGTDGEVTGAVVAWQDISDLKVAQEQLSQSYAQLQAVFNNMNEGLVFVDPAGNVLQRNRASLSLLGYQDDHEGSGSLDEAKTVFTLYTIGGDEVKPDDWPICRALRGETFTDLELRIRRHDDLEQEKILSFNGTCVRDNAGDVALGLLSLRDVTVRKEAEAALRRARDEAEAASRAKSEFLANTSHELRTPMTAIMGLFDVLQDGLLKPEDEYIALARQSAEGLMGLIEDLLDLSAVEAGIMAFEKEPFDLRQCSEGSFAELLQAARAKGLEFSVEVAPEAPQIFIGDSRRVAQVLTRLTENAIKFTDKGSILVRIAPDPGFQLGEGISGLEFSVLDSGIGIPLGSQKMLFDSFRQADGSSTRKHGGAGLGLSLCRKLVEGMGGRIGIESKEGEGSRFYFILPLLDQKALPHPQSVLSPKL